jgi:hypothetical protein
MSMLKTAVGRMGVVLRVKRQLEIPMLLAAEVGAPLTMGPQ